MSDHLFLLQKAVINTGIAGFQKARSEKLCSLDELAICVFQMIKKKKILLQGLM